MNSLVLAYLGDAIYELYIREFLISQGITKVAELQKMSLKYVSAKSQRKHLERLIDMNFLTEEELDIFKTGRNTKSNKPRNTDPITYHIATGLETLIGKLYIDNQKERIKEIMDFIVT